MTFLHRSDPSRIYGAGEHAWHYSTTQQGDSFRITVLRAQGSGKAPYCVCVMDTRSNPYAEQDADRICAALNTAGAPQPQPDPTNDPDAHPETRRDIT